MFNKNIDEILEKNIKYYAHSKEGSSYELLSEHMKLTYEYSKKIEKDKNLKNIIFNICEKLYRGISENIKEYIYELFFAAIYYHDIGKINPKYQKIKMNNTVKDDENVYKSEHAIYSSGIFLDAYIIKLLQEPPKSISKKKLAIVYYIIYSFSFVISRHHAGLDNIEKFLDNILDNKFTEVYKYSSSNQELKNLFGDGSLDEIIKISDIDKIAFYILNKLLFSVMVASDFYATYEYMSGSKVDPKIEKNENLFLNYTNGELYNKIRAYQNGEEKVEGINLLRNEMFIESEENLLKNISKNVYYLEAPTGSGKTNMAINLARIIYKEIKECQSINYIFPFNTLIEQTKQIFNKYFENYRDFVVINSLTPIIEEKNDDLNYEKAYIQNAFSNYKIKITSHVKFFDELFGAGKSENYPFINYINSVVIIDEIQAYNNKIWREIITMFDKYAELLNIKFIIMSATLPKLNSIIDDSQIKYCNLISDSSKYYNNSLFKNRVQISYELLDKKVDLELLKEYILKYKGKKILVEFIKKQTARDLYNLLIESRIENVVEITGDDNNYNRKNIISKIHDLESVIVIATQTIEAGVDIDMDIGFKDISIIDSEEQFLGRINRNCKRSGCKAYFFNLDDQTKIYKGDLRLEYNILDKKYQEILNDKNFARYYSDVLEKVKKETEKYNEKNINAFKNECVKLKYSSVEKKLKLIESTQSQIFINTTIKTEEGIISGKDIWNKYKEICFNKNIEFSEKTVKLSQIKPKLNLFIYNLYSIDGKKLRYYDEEFSGIFYIENGEELFVNGKFDRKKYNTLSGGIFL